MSIAANRALKTCWLVLLALCGCATSNEETVTVFEGSSPGTYWELEGWDSHEATGSWEPWTGVRVCSVVYVNEFRRGGWGTAAPWSWFSNGRCFLYQVMVWEESQQADGTVVEDRRFESEIGRAS